MDRCARRFMDDICWYMALADPKDRLKAITHRVEQYALIERSVARGLGYYEKESETSKSTWEV